MLIILSSLKEEYNGWLDMKKMILIAILTVLALLVAGCTAPTCYPPNKIIDNKCCVDDDDNSVCDYEEQTAKKDVTQTTTTVDEEDEEDDTVVMAADEEDDEPQIQKVTAPKPAPIKTGLQLGVQDMRLGEKRQYLEINQLSAYRTSRDKGLMDFMVLTVRNIGNKKLNAEVELYFEGARVEEHTARIKKTYTIPELEPNEKYVMNKSLGIRFDKIDQTKKMTLSVYEKFVAPKDELDVLKKEFVPTDYMESMEIFTYGLPEYG
jgi:hypothetical protein